MLDMQWIKDREGLLIMEWAVVPIESFDSGTKRLYRAQTQRAAGIFLSETAHADK